MSLKTRAEVEALKSEWYDDPHWPIEHTEGFEEYREELLIYRLECEATWRLERHQRLIAKAVELGVPENIKLAEYIERLEAKIADLYRRLEEKE